MFYVWQRQMFGARVALVATFLLAVSGWHIVFSRIGWRAILQPLVSIVAYAFFARGLRTRGVLAFAAAGAATAAAVYTYNAARLLPLLFPLYALTSLVLARDRRALSASYRRGALAMAGAFAIVVAPMAHYAATHWWKWQQRASATYFLDGHTVWENLDGLGEGVPLGCQRRRLLHLDAGTGVADGGALRGRNALGSEPMARAARAIPPAGLAGGRDPSVPEHAERESHDRHPAVRVRVGRRGLRVSCAVARRGLRPRVPVPGPRSQVADSEFGSGSDSVRRPGTWDLGPGTILFAFVAVASVAATWVQYFGPHRREIPGFYPETTVLGRYARGLLPDYDVWIGGRNFPRETLDYLTYRGGPPHERAYRWVDDVAKLAPEISLRPATRARR